MSEDVLILQDGGSLDALAVEFIKHLHRIR
jgi:hypothetical protein